MPYARSKGPSITHRTAIPGDNRRRNSPTDMAALVSVIGLILMTQACLPDLLHTSRMIIAVASRNVQRAEQNQVLCSAMKGCGEGFLGFVAARPAGLRGAGDHPLPPSTRVR